MLNQDDFELSLETQLKLRVLTDEIDQCSDIDALKKNLKEVTTLRCVIRKLLTECSRDR